MQYQFLIHDQQTNALYYFIGVKDVRAETRATLTEYSTPSGKRITDSYYVNPQTISFQLLTSSIAMTRQRVLQHNETELNTLTITDLKTLIRSWINSGTRLNITSFEGYYENMVMESLTEEEGERMMQWTPTMSFKQVRVANAETIQLENAVDAEEQADNNSETNLGANNGSVAGDVGSALGQTGIGALAGAALGSVIPGIGTAVGAVLGGVVGFFSFLLGEI